MLARLRGLAGADGSPGLDSAVVDRSSVGTDEEGAGVDGVERPCPGVGSGEFVMIGGVVTAWGLRVDDADRAVDLTHQPEQMRALSSFVDQKGRTRPPAEGVDQGARPVARSGARAESIEEVVEVRPAEEGVSEWPVSGTPEAGGVGGPGQRETVGVAGVATGGGDPRGKVGRGRRADERL